VPSIATEQLCSQAMEQGMTAIPDDSDKLLTRSQTAAALTAAGFPTSVATLSTKATRGGGPPYRRFGPRALYPWGSALSWAKGRLTDFIGSTSESDLSSRSSGGPSGNSAGTDGTVSSRDRRSKACGAGNRAPGQA
jgi:hypothetical protein